MKTVGQLESFLRKGGTGKINKVVRLFLFWVFLEWSSDTLRFNERSLYPVFLIEGLGKKYGTLF